MAGRRPAGPAIRYTDVEFAALERVDWFNNRRLLGPIGCVPPAECEEMFYRKHTLIEERDSDKSVSTEVGAVHNGGDSEGGDMLLRVQRRPLTLSCLQ